MSLTGSETSAHRRSGEAAAMLRIAMLSRTGPSRSTSIGYAAVMDPVDLALALRDGLVAWRTADDHVDRRALAKAFRDNWDRRIGKAKFGGVWSIAQARANPRHPASVTALEIGRSRWTGATVTVEHALPIRLLFDAFMEAESAEAMQSVIDAYHVAVVTRAEDGRLRQAGLLSTMPSGWQCGDDPMARWHSVGIVVADADAH